MDATPDDSVQDILQGQDSIRLEYVRHGPDEGQAAAIQEGWDQFRGDIVHWLNADDFLLPSALEAVASVFQSDPTVDVVYGDALFVDRDGRFTSYFPAISDQPSSLVETCCIAQPACFVRRLAVERVGGLNTNLHYIMDWDLWARLYLSGAKFYYLRRPLAATRMYPETKTSGGSAARLREIRGHLRTHAGLGKAMRATASFVADSKQKDRSLAFEVLAHAVRGYRKWKVVMAHAGIGSGLRELYGLEVHTNRVREYAELWLPWYGGGKPRELLVYGHGCGEMELEMDGWRTRASAHHTSAEGDELVFALTRELPDRMVRVKLRSRPRTPWRLIAASLR